MYFLTIQHKDVIDILLRDKIYYPNFRYTTNSAAGLEMRAGYHKLLNCFNHVNNMNLPGIIFGFQFSDHSNVDELYTYLIDNPNVATCLDLWSPDYCILKLKINDNVKVLPIDFYDFIKLVTWSTEDMSGISVFELDNYEIQRIVSNFSNGIVAPKFKSFTQIHYSHINIDEIVGVYPLIDYKSKVLMNLCKSASKLKFNLYLE